MLRDFACRFDALLRACGSRCKTREELRRLQRACDATKSTAATNHRVYDSVMSSSVDRLCEIIVLVIAPVHEFLQ